MSFPLRFMTCLPFTLAQEGRPGTMPGDWVMKTDPTIINDLCWSDRRNFSDDAHDPGGETFNGIEQREYTIWCKSRGIVARDVRGMSSTEGCSIYYGSYWLPHCDGLPAGFDLVYFDTSVNMGEHEATMILQHVIGVSVDGMWGAQTDAAMNARHVSAEMLINQFDQRRKDVYQEMKGFAYFGTDWLRRDAEIGGAALTMTRGS